MAMPRARNWRIRRKSRSTLARWRLLAGSSIRITRASAARVDDLLVGERQRSGARARVDLAAAEVGEEVRGARLERIAAQQEARAFHTEEYVLGHREMRTERELLMNMGDSCTVLVPRDRAAVGRDEAGEDVQQGALAGAVLADQRVHFAHIEREVDAVQRDGRAEALGDAAQLEDHFRYCSSGGCSNCCDVGVSRLAGVISVTPVSMRVSTRWRSRTLSA